MGYRPRVVIGDYTIKWFPKKYAEFLKSKDKARVEHALQYVKEKRFTNESIAVNNQNQWPNEQMRDHHVKRMFNRHGLKYSEDNIYLLREINVKSESKANYEV